MDISDEIKKQITYIYLTTSNDFSWEDQKIFLIEQDAINYSCKYPNIRVEIFCKTSFESGYTPTYSYYKQGILLEQNKS
jgi:hypothetical protein